MTEIYKEVVADTTFRLTTNGSRFTVSANTAKTSTNSFIKAKLIYDSSVQDYKEATMTPHYFVTPQNVDKDKQRFCAECGLYFTARPHVAIIPA